MESIVTVSVVVFKGDNVLFIKSSRDEGKLKLSLPMGKLRDFENIEEMTTGIKSIDQSNIKIKVDNKKLIIENAKVDDKIEIYNISGMKIKEQSIESDSDEILLSTGIYIICVENYSKKVIIK